MSSRHYGLGSGLNGNRCVRAIDEGDGSPRCARRCRSVSRTHSCVARPRITVGSIISRADAHPHIGRGDEAAHACGHDAQGGLQYGDVKHDDRNASLGPGNASARHPAAARSPLDTRYCWCLDEPVFRSRVDQAGIVNPARRPLPGRCRPGHVFIAHDLSVVRHISDDVAYLYMDQCVNRARPTRCTSSTSILYTQALLSAVPVPIPRKERHRSAHPPRRRSPSPIHPPRGCRFPNPGAEGAGEVRTDGAGTDRPRSRSIRWR